MTTTPKKPFHEQVAEKLIQQLKQGTAPWQRPWKPGVSSLPTNMTTGKRYKGINVVQLMSQNREDNRWMTYDQAKNVGGQVKRGEKGTTIQFWLFTEKQNKVDENGKPVLDKAGNPEKIEVKLERPKVMHSVVFNAEQIDGLPPQEIMPQLQSWEKIERAERVLNGSGAKLFHTQGDRAFYRLSTDSIQLPDKTQFDSADKYYATALHELGHWTGHPSRLDRQLGHPFGSEMYAKEELRAEISSMILGEELEIGHDTSQHVSYVGSWIKILENDPLEIFRAAADAEKIQTYILGLENTQQIIASQPQEQAQSNEQPGQLRMPLVKDIPEDWTGNALVTGIVKRIGDYGLLEWQDPEVKGIPAESYYVSIECGMRDNYKFVAEYPTEAEANEVMERMLDYLHYKPDLNAALALQSYRENPVEELGYALANTFRESFQINIPEHWSGHVSMHGCITVDEQGTIDEASENDVPEFYGLYATESSGTQVWLADYSTYDEAKETVDRLNRVNEMAKGIDMNSDKFMADRSVVEIVNDLFGRKSQSESEPNQKSEIPETQRTFISVPYSEKSEAKDLGAKWDKQERSWYVPGGLDLTPFDKWATVIIEKTPEPAQPELSNSKKYLAVPYHERAEAKAVGAKWDKEAKSWYVEPQVSYENVSKWLPENVEPQQDPALDPREEFRDALSDVGFELDGQLPEMDGKPHRCRVEGDKNSEKSGTYTGYLDGHPAGFMQNHRNGVKENWKSAGVKLDPAQKAALIAEAAGKLQEREATRLQQHESCSKRVQTKIGKLLQIDTKTPYLESKGISKSPGIFTDANTSNTFIPAYDSEGKVWTMQRIDEAGTKLFEKGGKKEGCFHVIGGYENLAKSPIIIISEGFATASSVSEAVGFSTVAAFDAGNLKTVAMALHEKFPDKSVLIAGDDDVHKKVNVGRQKAIEAAEAVNGTAVFPIFGDGEKANGLTDYNDLATKSKLGKGGVYRQMMAEVVSIITDPKNAVQIEERQSQRQTVKKAISH